MKYKVIPVNELSPGQLYAPFLSESSARWVVEFDDPLVYVWTTEYLPDARWCVVVDTPVVPDVLS